MCRYRSRKAKRKREQGQTDLVPIRIHDAGSPVGIVHRAGSAGGVEVMLGCARATMLSGESAWYGHDLPSDKYCVHTTASSPWGQRTIRGAALSISRCEVQSTYRARPAPLLPSFSRPSGSPRPCSHYVRPEVSTSPSPFPSPSTSSPHAPLTVCTGKRSHGANENAGYVYSCLCLRSPGRQAQSISPTRGVITMLRIVRISTISMSTTGHCSLGETNTQPSITSPSRVHRPIPILTPWYLLPLFIYLVIQPR